MSGVAGLSEGERCQLVGSSRSRVAPPVQVADPFYTPASERETKVSRRTLNSELLLPHHNM